MAASPEATWRALTAAVTGGSNRRAGRVYARLVGATHVNISGQPGTVGSTVAGFIVTAANEPSELVLEGAHRFGIYRLGLYVDDLGDGTSRLRAETNAAFIGVAGRIYKLFVIDSRAHVLLVRRMLTGIKGRAESEHSSA